MTKPTASGNSIWVVKPAFSRMTGATTFLTGDSSTSESTKATNTLSVETSKLKSKLKVLKVDVLAVTTSKAHKLLSAVIENGDKILVHSGDRVPG